MQARLLVPLFIVTLFGCGVSDPPSGEPSFGLVLHGGAGTITRDKVPPDQEEAYRTKIDEALRHGHGILARGGSSLDAVEQVIRIFEDSPLFNAGKGAVFTADGANELDASIMDGRARDSGAVAGVTRVKNPITLARLVMEKSPHVMLAGQGAEAFAEEVSVDMETPEYFFTEERWENFQARQKVEIHGTVGCAALDRNGNLAAGTSTGGMTGKRFGRIGDSPIVGAGTYADNKTCAVSCTGHGEFFIRFVVAYDISALMKYGGMTLQQAADKVILDDLKAAGAAGGAIAIDRHGNVAMPFNTPGMYRGYMLDDQEPVIRMFALSSDAE